MATSTRSTVIAIAAAIGVLLIVGIAVAIVRPGDLDDDTPATTEAEAPDQTTTTPAETTSTTAPAETTSTTTTEATTTTTASPTTADDAGATVRDEPLANSGWESLLGLGAALAAAAVALRRYCW